MAHWYDIDGQIHDVDLKTARKEGYVPSVTEIIYEFENSYGLQLYKAKQMFLASLTLPRPEGITDDDFFELVKKDSEEHSEKAKEFGTIVHVNIKNLLYEDNPIFYGDSNLAIKQAMKVNDWIKSNKDSVIVDFKTQETKNGKFKQPYDSWLFQLCGYYEAQVSLFSNGEYIEQNFSMDYYGGTIDYCKITENDTRLINIMISSNEDIPVKIYEWKKEKIKWGMQVFQAMLALYKILKKI